MTEKSVESLHVMRTGSRWQDLHLYRKSDTLYQLTVVFCRRFLPLHGDRTVDQMVQAARSGKQNIVEGSENGKTSTEMELKLLNVARSSISELREDYKDHLTARGMEQWDAQHPRYAKLREFTRKRNFWEDYRDFANRCTEEELSNLGLTLCYQMDSMLNRYLKSVEQHFITEGGLKERMHKMRTGYRQQQDEEFRQLQQENEALRQECQVLRQSLAASNARYNDLRARALKAYNGQKAQIEELQAKIGALAAQLERRKGAGSPEAEAR